MAGRKRHGAAQNKVPCKNPGICGTRNHILGTFSQQRCDEIANRRARGEVITPDMVATIVPPQVAGRVGEQTDQVRSEMDRLRSLADAWKDAPREALGFLQWSQGFTEYSHFNRLMIWLQNPEATQVAGRKKWAEQGREVVKDAKPISIFAPGYRPERPVKDEDGNPVLDENGEPVMERVFVSRFRAVKVFDIADTEGDTPPSVPVEVPDPQALAALASYLTDTYMLKESEAAPDAHAPARMNADGTVTYNNASADEDQRTVNRLVAAGMTVSAHLRAQGTKERRRKEDGDGWGNDEHLYAGVAVAWALSKDAGVDMTDMAVEQMSRYRGIVPTSTLAIHASKVLEHIGLVRRGMPLALADVFFGGGAEASTGL